MNEHEAQIPNQCRAIRAVFSPFLDHELDSEARGQVERHLHECADCLRELHGYKLVSDRYAALPRPQAPADFEARVLDRIAPRPTFTARLRQHWQSGIALAAVLLCTLGLTLFWTQQQHDDAPATALDYIARDDAPQTQEIRETEAPEMAPLMLEDAPPPAEVAEDSLSMDMGISVMSAPNDAAAPAPPSPESATRMLAAPAPKPETEATPDDRDATEGMFRIVADRAFIYHAGQWIESRDPAQRPDLPTDFTSLNPDSPELQRLLEDAPELRPLLDWDAPVYYYDDGSWYRLPQPHTE